MLSSILYLGGDEAMGPTIFLESVGTGCGWRVQPRANRYVAFPGSLLHGVLPASRAFLSPQALLVRVLAGVWLGMSVPQQP